MFKSIGKKGVEAQFHWIFVLVAGALVTLIFVYFTQNTQDAFEKKGAARVLTDFDTLFTSFTADLNSQRTFPSQDDIVLDFVCRSVQDSFTSTFKLKSQSIDKSLDHLIVFSHKLVGGRSIHVKTDDVVLPFPITNMIYVTDANTAYVLYNSASPPSDLTAKLNLAKSLLPKNATIIETNAIDDDLKKELSGYDRVSFIGGTVNVDLINDMKNAVYVYNIQIVTIDQLTNAVSGAVQFQRLQKDGTLTTAENMNVTTKEFFLGALMSDSVESYNCNGLKFQRQMEFMVDVLVKRAETMQSTYPADHLCKTYLGDAIIALKKVKSDFNKPNDFPESVKELEKANKDLISLSCPTVY